MAKDNLTTSTRQMWDLEEKFPPGPLKENITQIRVGMAQLDNVSTVLFTLAGFGGEDIETVRIAAETLVTLACNIETNVHGVFLHLNQIFEKGAPEVPTEPNPQEETPKATPGRFTLPGKVEEDLKQLDRLGDCLSTLAEAQEKMEEKTLLVTTDQLRSWGLICNHVAMWVPENLAAIAERQEGGAA